MTHHLINPTWACQLDCSYCWVSASVRERPEMKRAKPRPMADWAAAINRDRVDLVDVAGGEPLLLPWLPDLFAACPRTAFGLTTNGLHVDGLVRLARARPSNVVAVNVSYHPEAAKRPGYLTDYAAAINELRQAGLRVHVNIVAAPGNVEASGHAMDVLRSAGVHVAISPYERVSDLAQHTAQGLVCEGGKAHLNVAPDGLAWPCLTTMRSPEWRETCLGNWLDGEIDLTRKPQPCYLNCVDYYVLPGQHEAGDMWRVNARPATGRETP